MIRFQRVFDFEHGGGIMYFLLSKYSSFTVQH